MEAAGGMPGVGKDLLDRPAAFGGEGEDLGDREMPQSMGLIFTPALAPNHFTR